MRFWLIAVGITLVVLGLLWPLLPGLGLGRLPGDIAVHRRGFDLYFPLTTCIILSIVLSLILWWLRR
jgi:hypothetical protein